MPRHHRSLSDLGFTFWSPTLLRLIVSLILIATPSFTLGQGLVETIAIQGDIPPEGNGTFAIFLTPVLNDAGQVAFGVILINTPDAPDDDYGIYRADATPGSLVNIDRKFLNAFGIGVQSLDLTPAINNAGQVVTHRRALGLLSGDRDQYRISDGSSVTTIDLFGDAAPDGNGTFTGDLSSMPSLNDAGQVTFFGSLTGTSGGFDDDTGNFRSSGGTVTQIVREGQTAPDANGTFNTFNNIFGVDPALNDAGQVMFFGLLTGTSGGFDDNSGIFRGSGGAVTRIVREGQAAPDANGTFSSVFRPAPNDAGQAAFVASLAGTSGMDTDNSGIFRGSGGTITQIVRKGQAAPDANGMFDSFFDPALNDAGQAAFGAFLAGTSGMGGDDFGIFRGSGGTITQIAREGQAAPDANGTFDVFNEPALNDTGQAAFRAFLAGTSGMTSDDQGIFLGDGQEIITAAREGQPLAGSTIVTIFPFQGGRDPGGRSGLNAFGQVAYKALLDNGQQGVFLFTPELHWRTAGSGNWDDCTNWTIGTDPAQVHPVMIDPNSSLVVTGPGSATTVKSMTLGGGVGNATLALQATGPLTVEDGAVILANGALAGNGMIIGDVENGGLMSPGTSDGEIMIDGDYDQTGTLSMELASLASFDMLTITGEAMLAGTLEVSLLGGFTPSAGDTFEILTAAGGVNGTFASTLFLDPAGLLAMDLFYDTNSVTLAVIPALPGDFDIDGDVDGNDFLFWQLDPSVGLLADWEANYGMVVPLSATSTAVPEPATGLLLTLGMAVMLTGRRAAVSKPVR